MSHKTVSKRISTSVTAALVLGACLSTATTTVQAQTSASISVSNMYLFRGANLSKPGAHVAGSLDWAHDTGLYAGVWASSEGAGTNSSEVDYYVGFSNEIDGFSYDVGLIAYEYPGATGSEDYGDISEFMFSVGMSGFSLSVVDALHGAQTGGDFYYISFGYEMDKFGASYNMFSSDTVTEYSHIDLSYAATDEISFTLSAIIDDDDVATLDTDPLIAVSWSKSFDL